MSYYCTADMSGISNDSYGTDRCVICCKKFVDTEGPWVSVGEKGVSTLITCCKFINNAKLAEYLSSCQDAVNVHVDCRRNFTKRKTRFESECSEQGAALVPKKLRSSTPSFDWKSCCFFCGKLASVDDRHQERSDIHVASTLELYDSILDVCAKRMDAWSLEVQGRLQSCNDFVAAEAVYHQQCSVDFRLGRNKSELDLSCLSDRDKGKSGKRKSCCMTESFLEMCEWLEDPMDSELWTLIELRERMVERFGEESVYSHRQLKDELKAKYGEHIFFAEVNGRRNVVCLRDMASFLLNEKWYSDRMCNMEDESKRIVKAAAKLIRGEILAQQYSMDTYPSTGDINDKTSSKWVPPLLHQLLSGLVRDGVKCFAISNAVVQASRPRSVISPVLLGVGVEMDHVFGSRWLVDELSRLGFSVSYDEVTRYKQSVLQDGKFGDVSHYPACFTQWVGDNVDHNSGTLDGKSSFHGMGVIAVSTPTDGQQQAIERQAVQRVKRKPVATAVGNLGIPVLTYHFPESLLAYRQCR